MRTSAVCGSPPGRTPQLCVFRRRPRELSDERPRALWVEYLREKTAIQAARAKRARVCKRATERERPATGCVKVSRDYTCYNHPMSTHNRPSWIQKRWITVSPASTHSSGCWMAFKDRLQVLVWGVWLRVEGEPPPGWRDTIGYHDADTFCLLPDHHHSLYLGCLSSD